MRGSDRPASTRRRESTPETRKYCFLTYVMGGGVETHAHEKPTDGVTPVRAASIRGQLRFWWRACNPGGCTTLDELRQQEAAIWGATGIASPVVIEVLDQPATAKKVQVFQYNEKGRLVPRPGMREIAYGAFALQPDRDSQKQGAKPGVLFDYGRQEFRLGLTYPPDLQEHVHAALWAWETFGGLGARTRRGFGAIARLDAPARVATPGAQLGHYQKNPRFAGVPSLTGARFAVAPRVHRSPLDAWKDGLGKLQRLRQGAGLGRNFPASGSRSPAGRSLWPEPDEIRRLTGKTAPRHSDPVVSVQSFPRAAFGMPIVFHFHPGSREEPDTQGDPDSKPLELRPSHFERFASPLVLRPLGDGKDFRAAALVLASEIPSVVLLAGKSEFPARWSVEPAEAAAIPVLSDSKGKVFTDPLERLLAELQK